MTRIDGRLLLLDDNKADRKVDTFRSALFLSCREISADKVSAVFGVDLADFLQAVNIRLIQLFDAAAACIVTAGAEFTFTAAIAKKRLTDDFLTFLTGGILNQNGIHFVISLRVIDNTLIISYPMQQSDILPQNDVRHTL